MRDVAELAVLSLQVVGPTMGLARQGPLCNRTTVLFEDSESPCDSPLLGSMAAMVAYMALH